MNISLFTRREKRNSHDQHTALTASVSRLAFFSPVLNVPLTVTILFTLVLVSSVETTNHPAAACEGSTTHHESAGGNIREVIPDRLQKRYQKWKKEYLSTEAGRKQWERYDRNRNFTLTITVSAEKGRDAEVGEYRWNESDQLIAATITLGSQLDKGYPCPSRYPVTSSLAPAESTIYISGSVLAATKMAHEFGHVNHTARTNAKLYQLQDKLIPVYNQIFFTKGKNIYHPQLIELVQQMRGTPVEIGRDRELWAETEALLYLRERYPDEDIYRPIFQAIQRAVKEYAKEHVERFR